MPRVKFSFTIVSVNITTSRISRIWLNSSDQGINCYTLLEQQLPGRIVHLRHVTCFTLALLFRMNLISANHFTGNWVKQFSALKLSLSFRATIGLKKEVHKIVIGRLTYCANEARKRKVEIFHLLNVSCKEIIYYRRYYICRKLIGLNTRYVIKFYTVITNRCDMIFVC